MDDLGVYYGFFVTLVGISYWGYDKNRCFWYDLYVSPLWVDRLGRRFSPVGRLFP